MSAIWKNDGDGWRLAAPAGFSLEADLHDLVAESPQLLPLAGSPSITVVGREVRLGNGWADLLAVEASGRPVVIEVKLRNNAEARRAVVAQVLTYAAYLHGLDVADFETNILGTHLRERGVATLLEAASANDQAGAIDAESFAANLAESLATGAFRLIIVLDDAPVELVELVGYLETVAERLVIDLVTVSMYEVGGAKVLVPQRIEPARASALPSGSAPSVPTKSEGYLAEGIEDFVARVGQASGEHEARLRRLVEWASELEAEGLVDNATYHGKGDRRITLLPRFRPTSVWPGRVGLVTIYNDAGTAYLQFWRSVFERRAPNALAVVNELIAPLTVGQGNTTREVTDELLAALTEAYREAMTATRG